LSIVETVLIFVGIPAAVLAVVYGLVYAGSARRGKRYRPGRPYEFRPVWFLSAPEQLGGVTAERKALDAGDTPAALPPASVAGASGARASAAGQRGEWPAGDPAQQGATGGASDSW
jgi:hypothetical protein